ncbi:hypothetical protein VCSRO200_2163 [Vibrio cholerae]|nr:hypothetical protein VCSRO200_2163 [Vibrio cholerae]
MATNPPSGDGHRNGAVKGRSQTQTPSGHWVMHISEHSDQSFRDYPITHFGLNRSLIPRLSDHF